MKIRRMQISAFYLACLEAEMLPKNAVTEAMNRFRGSRGKRISRATVYRAVAEFAGKSVIRPMIDEARGMIGADRKMAVGGSE